jgi:hypothetical protein
MISTLSHSNLTIIGGALKKSGFLRLSIASSTASGYRGEYRKWEDWVRSDRGRGSGADPEKRDLTEDTDKARLVAEYTHSQYL